MADRARETLRAVATDDELRDEFEDGRVVTDREPVGFGSAPAPKPAPKKQATDRRRSGSGYAPQKGRGALAADGREALQTAPERR